ncbi:Phosphopantetheine adenylyltransferase [Ligilactobacillus sp. WC1T17]|uniref:Phosphopantetheine adenylyltransferase n=1 Tax=Ligilactobacillus ruminis TaxID=1623 RepID=A0ABY1ABR7_9LACO|nr:Phosphopantetheine adenylyltransferase [Ligilactobacillus ruminis]
MKAVFPGTFDPLTMGHLDLIKRASKMFDQVTVLVATNTSKKAMFSFAERKALLEQEIAFLPNVNVIAAPKDLTVNVAKKIKAQAIIRGVRDAQDFEYEKAIALMNRHLAPEIETVLLLTDARYSFLSSSIVKEVALFGGDLTGLLPDKTAQALREKVKQYD